MAIVDADVPYGGKIKINQNGGIASCTGWELVSNFIQRLLYTNFQTVEPSGVVVNPDYIWHPTFGLGLRALVGEADLSIIQQTLKTKALQAIAAQPSVATTPAPVVLVEPDPNDQTGHTLLVYIYLYLNSGQAQTLGLIFEV